MLGSFHKMSVSENLVKATVEKTPEPPGTEIGSDGEEWLERGNHPLLNDLILGTLFGFVRRFDLKSCRIVCKNWNLRTIPHMRSSFKVAIRGSQPTNQKASDANQKTRRIDDFVELFSSNELGIPFGKFQLGPFCTTDGVGKQFLEICGQTATEIDLDLNEEKSEDYMIEDVSELLRASPNIKALALPSDLISRSGNVVKLSPDSIPTLIFLKKITFRPDHEGKGLKYCPTLIEELFTTTPKVSDIVVRNTFNEDGNGEENGIGIDAVLNVIEKLRMESSIQSLDLGLATIVQIEQLLRMGRKENGLKLKSLILSSTLFTVDEISAVQIQLATCFKDSLQHFRMPQIVNNNLMEFPYMPNLKSSFFGTFRDWDSKPVNLNMCFPVLETFSICLQDKFPKIRSQFFSKFESCPTVKSFHVSIGKMRSHTFHNILRVFPNLTKLDVQVHKDGVEVLRLIWSQMTGLESLSIHGYIKSNYGLCLDSLFTGIPAQALKGLSDVVNGLNKMTLGDRREAILKLRNEHCRLPSIGNLTKLRHLDLDVDGGRSRSMTYLSDVTAYLALHSMHRLNHLGVKRSVFTQTSCELLKQTGLHTWFFQNTGLENIIPPFFLPNREISYN